MIVVVAASPWRYSPGRLCIHTHCEISCALWQVLAPFPNTYIIISIMQSPILVECKKAGWGWSTSFSKPVRAQPLTLWTLGSSCILAAIESWSDQRDGIVPQIRDSTVSQREEWVQYWLYRESVSNYTEALLRVLLTVLFENTRELYWESVVVYGGGEVWRCEGRCFGEVIKHPGQQIC